MVTAILSNNCCDSVRLAIFLSIEINYPVVLSFLSDFLFNEAVNADGTVSVPNEICLRSCLTVGSGFLSGFRLLTSVSYIKQMADMVAK